jgi:hypothetical protein
MYSYSYWYSTSKYSNSYLYSKFKYSNTSSKPPNSSILRDQRPGAVSVLVLSCKPGATGSLWQLGATLSAMYHGASPRIDTFNHLSKPARWVTLFINHAGVLVIPISGYPLFTVVLSTVSHCFAAPSQLSHLHRHVTDNSTWTLAVLLVHSRCNHCNFGSTLFSSGCLPDNSSN